MSEAQIKAIEAAWQTKVEEARKEGYLHGARETEATVMQRYEELSERLKGITDAIYEQWSGLAAVLERQAVDLALQVSKKILSTTVDAKPDYILTVIRQGLSEMGAAKPVRIRVSAEDFEFLNVIGLPMDLSEKELGVTYVADDTIKSGCIIETNFGEVDLVLDRMWEQIRDLIYQNRTE
jgi:flagellar assembly protein FliH